MTAHASAAAPRPAALVTGAARRLGAAMALGLARRGWDVAAHYHGSADDAEALATAVAAEGGRCVPLAADLTDRAQVLALVDRAAAALPSLALLVNNASVFQPGRLVETEPELLDRCLALHVTAPFLLTRAFARRCGRGLVVNLLDTRVAREATAHLAYTLSKKALLDLTRLAAVDLAPEVRVNAIAPGVILPPPGAAAGYLERRAGTVPLRRVGDPAAIVRALEYLIDQPFVTGECLFVDGGEHLSPR